MSSPDTSRSVLPKDKIIVLNDPEEIQQSVKESASAYSGLNVLTMRVAFSKLIRDSRKQLQIISPYIDRNSVTYFLDDFVEAFSRGIEFTLVTRGVMTKEPQSSRYSYVMKLEAIGLLWEHYLKLNPNWRTKFIVRDYLSLKHPGVLPEELLVTDGIDTADYGFLSVATAVHQKVIVSDKTIAYLGSGELRRNSFSRTAEVGIIVQGEQARFLSDLVQCYASRGKPVEPTFIDNLI